MYRLFASEQIITPQAVAQITPIDYISLLPWSHIRYILDKGYSAEKSFYYVLKTIEYGWSLNFMSADLYESEGKSINNFPMTMPQQDSDFASEIIKNPYRLDFLELRLPQSRQH